MDGRSKTRRFYYECPTHKKKQCKTKSINAEYIENYVVDFVIKIINENDLSNELISKRKEKITYLEGILLKNKKILKEKKDLFDALIKKSINQKNPSIQSRLEKRIEELSNEIECYEAKVNEQNLNIQGLKSQDFSTKITKSEFLNDRILAKFIIREVIVSIEVDELSGEIIINTY